MCFSQGAAIRKWARTSKVPSRNHPRASGGGHLTVQGQTHRGRSLARKCTRARSLSTCRQKLSHLPQKTRHTRRGTRGTASSKAGRTNKRTSASRGRRSARSRPVEVEFHQPHDWRKRVRETYAGIANVVLHDFVFVQPAKIAVMESLRQVPVVKRLQSVLSALCAQGTAD